MSVTGKVVALGQGVTRSVLETVGLTANGVVVTAAPAIQSITAGTGAPTALVALDSGKRINNTGTTVKAAFTLPTAAAGLHFYVDNVDSDGIRVNANTGDVIRLVDTTSAAAGYVESVRTGSSLHLVAVDDTTWHCDAPVGTWRTDVATGAGYAYTPTPWTAFTLAHTWDADVDVSEADCYYMQSGNNIRMRGRIAFAGAPPNTELSLTIAGGYTSLTTLGEGGSSSLGLGAVSIYDQGVGILVPPAYPLVLSNSTTITFRRGTTTLAAFSATAPITWASGDYIRFDVEVPVQ